MDMSDRIVDSKNSFSELPPDKWFKLILKSLKETMIHVL